jgi:hypothetical protein
MGVENETSTVRDAGASAPDRCRARATALGSTRNGGGAAANLTMQVVPSVAGIFLFRGNLGSLGDWLPSTNDNDLTGSITFEIE